MMNFTITENLDDPRIIPFLLNDNRATIYHHPAWLKALVLTYGFKPYYLILENPDDNSIIGLMPFILKNNIKRKKRIVSLPFTTHCDLLLPENISLRKIFDFLSNQLSEIDSIDLRFTNGIIPSSFSISQEYLLHKIKLGPTIDETFESFGRRSIRRNIRKAEDNSLKIRFGESIIDLKIFYELEKKTRKKIGLPPAPFNFFWEIWKNLKIYNLILLPIIEYNSIPVASSIVLKFKDTFYFEYTGIDKKYINLYPNHMLHWEVIKIAQTEYGAKYIDMGRTGVDQQSLIYFKEKWNAKASPLFRACFPAIRNNNFKRSSFYNSLKNLNKLMPDKILDIEGRILFKYID